MGYTIRQMENERTFCRELTVEALQRAVPPEVIQAVLRETGRPVRRARTLTAEATIWVLIALNVYTHLAVGHVLRKVSQGLRFIWPDPTYRVPGASAFVYRRYQLGAPPVVALYERLARPIATAQTPGAFRFGLRLMALDGTVEDVPDSPANAAAFGRQHGSRGDSAFPQVQGVYLVECGTHAIVDATFGPYGTSERACTKGEQRVADRHDAAPIEYAVLVCLHMVECAEPPRDREREHRSDRKNQVAAEIGEQGRHAAGLGFPDRGDQWRQQGDPQLRSPVRAGPTRLRRPRGRGPRPSPRTGRRRQPAGACARPSRAAGTPPPRATR